MGKVFHLNLRIKPFALLFWALGIVLAHILKQLTQPAGLASLNSCTGTVLYGRGSVRFNLRVRRQPPFTFLCSCIIYLWEGVVTAIEYSGNSLHAG